MLLFNSTENLNEIKVSQRLDERLAFIFSRQILSVKINVGYDLLLRIQKCTHFTRFSETMGAWQY